MRTTDSLRTGQNATANDCGRLWNTLTTEYISKLEIQLVMFEDPLMGTGIRLELVDDGPAGPDGHFHQNVWSTVTIFNQLHLISSSRLFDLLISGYRKIDDFFTHGERFAPERRQV